MIMAKLLYTIIFWCILDLLEKQMDNNVSISKIFTRLNSQCCQPKIYCWLENGGWDVFKCVL